MDRFIYFAQLAVPAELEPEFNALYDSGYVPNLLKIAGVRSCTRYRLEWTDGAEMPEYLAIYELDDPEIPRSAAWKQASVDCGWADRIRPRLTLRRHGMYRQIAQARRA